MDPKVEQFVSVTGAEVEEARSLLEACGGNLDLAVNMHMEGRPGLSSENKDTAGESYEDMLVEGTVCVVFCVYVKTLRGREKSSMSVKKVNERERERKYGKKGSYVRVEKHER